MKRVIVGLAGLALWAAVLPQSASAASGCAGPTGFQVCASIGVSSTWVGAGHWTLEVTVENLFGTNGVSHNIIGVGIGSNAVVSSWSLTSATLYTGGPGTNVMVSGGWQAGSTPPNANSIGAGLDDVWAKSGAAYGVTGGNTLVLVFDYYADVAITDANVTEYGWHAAAVDGTTCSLWANTDGGYVGDNLDTCTSTVPEPVTMVLLGTGLAGIGALRRRRKGLDVENA